MIDKNMPTYMMASTTHVKSSMSRVSGADGRNVRGQQRARDPHADAYRPVRLAEEDGKLLETSTMPDCPPLSRRWIASGSAAHGQLQAR